MIRVGHPAYVVTQRTSNCPSASLVLLTPETQFKLHGPKPRPSMGLGLFHENVFLTRQPGASIKTRRVRLNAGTKIATHHLVDWQSCGLSFDVPKGDIDAAESLNDRSFLAMIAQPVVKLFPDHFIVQRIATDQHWCIDFLDNRRR